MSKTKHQAEQEKLTQIRRGLWEQRPQCCYCGKPLAREKEAKLDHVLPVSRGGTDGLGNLRVACLECKLAKNNRTLQEWQQSLTRQLAGVCDLMSVAPAPRAEDQQPQQRGRTLTQWRDDLRLQLEHVEGIPSHVDALVCGQRAERPAPTTVRTEG